MVVEVPREERLLRSLVENIARRYPRPLALMQEIERLKGLGYTNVEVGEKLGICDTVVGAFLALRQAGEERLDAAMAGRIPLTVAMDIAKAETPELQRELLKAFETKQLNGVSIRAVKRLIDQRRFAGKQRDGAAKGRPRRTSVEGLVNAYKRESQRQRLLVKKARLCEERMAFVTTALKRLLGGSNFVTLLKAENLMAIPKYVWQRLGSKTVEGL